MSDVETSTPESSTPDQFTPAERSYFDSRGESALDAPPKPAEPPAQAPQQDAQTPQEPTGDGRQVNYGALHEERSKRREAQEQLRQAQIYAARLEERFRTLAPQPQQPKKPPT